MKITLPVYQHPTLVTLVDDSSSFVESLVFQMSPSMALKTFQDPNEALRWLEGAYDTNSEKCLPIRVGYDEQTYSFERRTIALDVDRVYRIAMDPRRFYAPAVVVVDYGMPQINGIEFCRSLAQLPCKKILFTGEANEMVAVDGFNRGLIDRYLKKSDSYALDRLEGEIASLERDYFIERSGTLKDLLVKHSYSFMSDDAFATLVHSLSEEYGFVEHYLFPDPSGILFFDANGQPKLMVVETKVGLTSHLETAQDYAAPIALQEALKNEKVVPFFWRSGGMYTEKSQDWEQYCLTANVCSGREDYFWALFDLPPVFLNGPVYSYNQFLQDRAHIASF
jgi:CheY-like chemotaxis protein